MKVGLERVGAVVGTLLLAFALLLVNSPVRAASYVATDASSTTSSVITNASDSGAEMSVGSAVLYVIVGGDGAHGSHWGSAAYCGALWS